MESFTVTYFKRSLYFVLVLMFPPDKSHKELSKRIRQPAMKLHSQHFADPPKEPKDEVKTPTEEEKMAAKATKVSILGKR